MRFSSASGSSAMPPSKTSAPFYPEKEQMQTSWKFPLSPAAKGSPGGAGLGLGVSSIAGSSSSTPLTSPISANAPKPVVVPQATPKTEAEIRAANIKAWLDSEDPNEESMDDDKIPPSAIESPTSIVPSEIMMAGVSPAPGPAIDLAHALSIEHIKRNSAQAADAVKELSMSYDDDDDEDEAPAMRVRVSGKSIKPLKITKERRDEAEEQSPLSPQKFGLGSPLPSSSSRASSPRKAARELSPVKQGASSKSATAGLPKREAISNSRAEAKNGSFKLGCGCSPKDDRKTMVQCDGCEAWYHLHCLGLRRDSPEFASDDWYCSGCAASNKKNKLRQQKLTAGEESYPSPDSPAKQSLDLANPPAFLRKPHQEETPTTPKLGTSSGREPTFSHSTTPKIEHARRFEDAHLVPPPALGRAMPITPQAPGSGSSSHAPWESGHGRAHSLSRQYAPVTPRLGGITASALTPAPTAMRKSESLWANYAPTTPSTIAIAAPAHGRRLSRHFRTPSGAAAAAFHWEELGAPSSSSSRGSGYMPKSGGLGMLTHAGMDEDAEKARQWGLFYSGGLGPASTASAALQAHTLLGDPLMQQGGPAYGQHIHGHQIHHHTHHHSQSADFLPPLDPEEAARQRFLELNSTPSRWEDSARFPTMMWD